MRWAWKKSLRQLMVDKSLSSCWSCWQLLERTWNCVVACGCDEVGREVDDCDNSGQCICKQSFTGRTCDRCAAGFYRYPECIGALTLLLTYYTLSAMSSAWFVDPLDYQQNCRYEFYWSLGKECLTLGHRCRLHFGEDVRKHWISMYSDLHWVVQTAVRSALG